MLKNGLRQNNILSVCRGEMLQDPVTEMIPTRGCIQLAASAFSEGMPEATQVTRQVCVHFAT